MQIVEARPDGSGIVELEGTRYEVNLSLIDAPIAGEYVIVHAGYAIEKLNEREAAENLELFRELAEAVRPPAKGTRPAAATP